MFSSEFDHWKIPLRLLTPYLDNQVLPEEKSYLGVQNHIYAPLSYPVDWEESIWGIMTEPSQSRIAHTPKELFLDMHSHTSLVHTLVMEITYAVYQLLCTVKNLCLLPTKTF